MRLPARHHQHPRTPSPLTPASALAIATTTAILVLAACGQTSPPSAEDLTQKLSDPANYFVVTRPDGSTMVCNHYGAHSRLSQDSKSWFAYSCDWSGTYTAPTAEGMPRQ